MVLVLGCVGWFLVAIYHCSVKSISRGKGHSATAAAAYRAGIRIEDQRTGLVHDYTRRGGVVVVEMLAPKRAPAWASDPELLWNAAEQVETRANARVARELVVALPHEMSDGQRHFLASEIGQMLVDRYQVAVQVAIHAPDKKDDDRNHHAHILFTSRQIGPQGLLGYSAKVLDDFKAGPAEILALREIVGTTVNQHLNLAGIASRIDHRSLEDQAIAAAEKGDMVQARALDRAPTIKEGRKPGLSDSRKAINASIRDSNETRQKKWDMWEEKARNEGRLMPASSDAISTTAKSTTETNINPRNNDDGEQRIRTKRSRPRNVGRPASDAQPDGSALTDGAIDTHRLRLDRDGSKPVLSLSGGDGLTDVQRGWGAKLSSGEMRGNEPRHSGDSETLHLSSGIAKQSIHQLGREPTASPSTTIAQPKAAQKPLTGKSAQAAVLQVGRSMTGSTKSTAGADNYSRERMSMDDEALALYQQTIGEMQQRLKVESRTAQRLVQLDTDFRTKMATNMTLTAINWRSADTMASDAQAWLGAHLDEEYRRQQKRDKAKVKMEDARIVRDRWLKENPEPVQMLWKTKKHTAWENGKKRAQVFVDTAKSEYVNAWKQTEPIAYQRLEMEREQHKRVMERAIAERQRHGELPSETYAKKLHERLQFKQRPASEPDFAPENKGSGATPPNRWERPQAPKPPWLK